MNNSLVVKNLSVKSENKQILSDISLSFLPGEVHAIMGPNGHGKSTLLQTIMGNPTYNITSGEIILNNKVINNEPPDERSKRGIFLAMQQPQEVAGVVNLEFLRVAMNNHLEKKESFFEFYSQVQKAAKKLKIDFELLKRHLNENFSGGEKKRNEILQMLLLNPSFILIDEIDSGLDVDGLKIISEVLNNKIKQSNNLCLVIVSHYERIFSSIKPTHVHLMVKGKIIKTEGPELIKKINEEGYGWISGSDLNKPSSVRSIGSCAVNKNIQK